MLPYVNATLTAITAVGSSDDFDTGGTAGASRWAGSQPITVVEQVVETDGLQQDERIQTRVEIAYSVGRLVERGDTLTYLFNGGTVARIAKDLIRAPQVGRVRVLVHDA